MQNITLTFTPAQLNVINKALMLAPYGEAAPVVSDINAQIQAQFDKRQDDNENANGTAPSGDDKNG
ncbi:hypothetical protein KDW78_19940 [Burkholderia cenocepacia]|uniref:hypothetical protein n=1 Tax=Burkholderia cenocepacia TaxID=95486 RepID=UPI00158E15BF|nr:hypothetical protein [Burkholderia cenocepacia]MBR7956148.1 hypothetical protein [Burkholderia cenocepacia]